MKSTTQLRDAVEKMHGCKAKHLRSVAVHEVLQGRTVWQGVVEVFQLSGHPEAKRCHAWSYLEGDKDERTHFVAALELPPVDSARKAVQVAIASQVKRQ